MGERSLDFLAALSLQALPLISLATASVGVCRFALRLGLFDSAVCLTDW
jgi:hypothetical protein